MRLIPADDAAAMAAGEWTRERCAGYLAKYATKHTEAVGRLDRRLEVADLPHLAVSPHIHRLVIACWLLASAYPQLRLDAWSHQLGYGGHWLTKSRSYSTTFTRLRAAREQWSRAGQTAALVAADPWDRMKAAATTVVWSRWQLVGVGHPDQASAAIAAGVRAADRDLADQVRADRTQRDQLLEDLALDVSEFAHPA